MTASRAPGDAAELPTSIFLDIRTLWFSEGRGRAQRSSTSSSSWSSCSLPRLSTCPFPTCTSPALPCGPSPHVCLRSRRSDSAFPPSAPSQVLTATSFQIQLFSPHHMFYSFVKFIYSGNFQIYTLRKCQNSVNNSHGSIIQLQ